MKPESRFEKQPPSFWANVRTVSESVGYTKRRTKGHSSEVKVPTPSEIIAGLRSLGLRSDHLFADEVLPTTTGRLLLDYFAYRASALNDYVEPRLMDADRARKVFLDLKERLQPSCPLPMNKQKGKKKAPAYLTSIVNMLIEAGSEGNQCDYDPHHLTTFTRDGIPVRTLARRVDGAFPSSTNPVAVWEIKEYYHTTTFGSRVADGIYESLLDGLELEELREHEKIKTLHYLVLDSHHTWWECGRSYLCRAIDILHMGYVDEILFGYEVVERLPELVSSWVKPP
jgi:hypothetical protein